MAIAYIGALSAVVRKLDMRTLLFRKMKDGKRQNSTVPSLERNHFTMTGVQKIRNLKIRGQMG